jgi:hypothetical protein
METKQHPEWKMLFEIYKDHPYDTLIYHSELEEALKLTRDKKPEDYYRIITKWRDMMLTEAQRQIECEYTVGYRIVRPEEFRTSAHRQMRLGSKRMKKAGKIIHEVPVSLLTEEEKRKAGEFGCLIAQVLHFSKATMRKVKEIDKKTDQLLLDVGKALDIAD